MPRVQIMDAKPQPEFELPTCQEKGYVCSAVHELMQRALEEEITLGYIASGLLSVHITVKAQLL